MGLPTIAGEGVTDVTVGAIAVISRFSAFDGPAEGAGLVTVSSSCPNGNGGVSGTFNSVEETNVAGKVKAPIRTVAPTTKS
jgi:hypothetical protein